MSGEGGVVEKLHFMLRFSAQEQLNTLLQVGDGQRLLTIEDIGDEKRRSEIDLGRIRPPLMLTQQSVANPVNSLYLAIGGQAEVLRKLCQQYEWIGVQEAKLAGFPRVAS